MREWQDLFRSCKKVDDEKDIDSSILHWILTRIYEPINNTPRKRMRDKISSFIPLIHPEFSPEVTEVHDEPLSSEEIGNLLNRLDALGFNKDE